MPVLLLFFDILNEELVLIPLLNEKMYVGSQKNGLAYRNYYLRILQMIFRSLSLSYIFRKIFNKRKMKSR